MGSLGPWNQNSFQGNELISIGEYSAREKEDPTQIFKNEIDEQGFPKVFALKTIEVRMFLRVVTFYTCRLVWEKNLPRELGALEILLGLQFIEWFENLSVTSSLFNSNTHLLYSLWNIILNEREGFTNFQRFNKSEIQKMINEHPELYGKLSFRSYRSECKRDTFLIYIRDHIVSQREIQRKHQVHVSHFRRSSDHSNSSRENSSIGNYLSPKVREFDSLELWELLKLSTHERKIQLMSESSEVS